MSYTIGPDAPLNAFNNDQEIEALFTLKADIQAMLKFETSLVAAQAQIGVVSKDHAEEIKAVIAGIALDETELAADFHNDGVLPPSLVRQVRTSLGDDLHADFHFGATSQDLVDSSVMMRLRKTVELVEKRLDNLSDALDDLVGRSAKGQILNARTRMQNALPISASEKVENWKSQISNLKRAKPDYFPIQLGGPEGAARKFGEPYDALCKAVADSLGLHAPHHHWQTDRQPLLAIASWFSSVATFMGKIGQDILMMAQTEIGEITLESRGQSSAMPHKKNPVLAEIIVAQARYCHAQMSGLQSASIHENERSGSSWSLEWMLLPALIITASKSILNASELIKGAQFQPPQSR